LRGVIGAACAYYLNRSGWSVTLGEESLRFGCSHGNCGSSVRATSAAPGRAHPLWPQSAFESERSFTIKPRLDLALCGWLLRFARRCNQRDMLRRGPRFRRCSFLARLYDDF